MNDINPYTELRQYLDSIGAPSDAVEVISRQLRWRPPALWEAVHTQADAINASVVAPEGMRHVGWFCSHPPSKTPPYGRENPHRKKANNKRGYKVEKNVGRSLSFGDYDHDIACPQRVPAFIRDEHCEAS